ncbi:HD domain-containing protein [Lentisphaerota bacterium ZTH]|nr:HD domain-containing protein [Lentisphaerota bacterium]WET05614.1 HD domain-containing protein [Lentisphaerota bacterium ZTH]
MDFENAKKYVIERLRKELPEEIFYHGPQHTLDVIRACEVFAAGEVVAEHDVLLLKTAALFHDIGFIYRLQENEGIGAEIARQELSGFGYTQTDIDKVARLIMATVLAHKPEDVLEKIIKDADLEYVGSERFERHAGELRRELAAHGRDFTDSEWLDFEIGFMKVHKFYTETCKGLRQKTKDRNLQKLLRARADCQD